MIKRLVCLCFVGFISTMVKADIPPGYIWNKNLVDISIEVPPALMFIQDANANRTGGNPLLPVDSNGRQGKVLSGLKEIPLSSVEQTNIGSDDPGSLGTPQPDTTWTVHLLDGGSQTYTVNLIGLQTGMSEITVTQYIAPRSGNRRFQSTIESFVSKGVTTQLALTINAQNGTISSVRVVPSGGLLSDVQTACQLGQITSPLACRFLTDEAKLIQTALEKNREQEAEDLTWVFLHSLGFSRPLGCKDEDHHSEVKQPALGILQEDAKALLDQLEKNPGHPSR